MVVLVAMIVETLCIGDSKCEADVVNEEQVDIARLDQKYIPSDQVLPSQGYG